MVLGDIRKIPFRDDAFDSIICNSVLEHISDTDSVLREFKRISKETVGRFLYISVGCKEENPILRPLSHRVFGISRELDAEGWKRKFEANDFIIVKERRYFSVVLNNLYVFSLVLIPTVILSKLFKKLLMKLDEIDENKRHLYMECAKLPK